jgi:hypothetical protein
VDATAQEMTMPRETPAPLTTPDDDGDLLDLEAREELAADEVPEVDTASSEDELGLELEAHASEDIVGDVDGDDYRAGTLDPEGTDRGPRGELNGDRLSGDDARR